MTVETLERRAATAALVAVALLLAAYALALLALPDPSTAGGVPASGRWASWMRLPQALNLLVGASVPTVGAVLLRGDEHRRREVGAALVAVYGLPAAFGLLPFLLGFGPAVEGWFLVHGLLFVGFLVAATLAGFLAAVALLRDPSVGWSDPWTSERTVPRVAAFVAIVLLATVYVAPTTRVVGSSGVWFGTMLLGGQDLSALLRQLPSGVLPPLGLIVVAVAVVGSRPSRVAVGAGAVVVADELTRAIGTPINNAMSARVFEQPVELTVWYGIHLAAVVALAVALVALWRPTDAVREPEPIEQTGTEL